MWNVRLSSGRSCVKDFRSGKVWFLYLITVQVGGVFHFELLSIFELTVLCTYCSDARNAKICHFSFSSANFISSIQYCSTVCENPNNSKNCFSVGKTFSKKVIVQSKCTPNRDTHTLILFAPDFTQVTRVPTKARPTDRHN